MNVSSASTPTLFDAHNHLHDERLGTDPSELVSIARQAGVAWMVVNGSCESDWPAVARLAALHPKQILPSFGYHPWYLSERSPDWKKNLTRFLESAPSAVGEIGLDRWKPGLAYDGQEEAFLFQLDLAASANLPASIHCLKSWGRMDTLLRVSRRPARGFLLHSYGGPPEMIAGLVQLGAYFSFPGYYMHERKLRQRETFLEIPLDRLLVETDAPDQALPADRIRYHAGRLDDPRAPNHPANLAVIYEFLADWRRLDPGTLTAKVGENFHALFGGVIAKIEAGSK